MFEMALGWLIAALVLFGYNAWRDRARDAERQLATDRFELERKHWREDRKTLLAEFTAEREVWADERRNLNNRLQAPEAAPFIEAETQNGGGIDPNDDGAYWDADEQMREAVERMRREIAE